MNMRYQRQKKTVRIKFGQFYVHDIVWKSVLLVREKKTCSHKSRTCVANTSRRIIRFIWETCGFWSISDKMNEENTSCNLSQDLSGQEDWMSISNSLTSDFINKLWTRKKTRNSYETLVIISAPNNFLIKLTAYGNYLRLIANENMCYV